MCYVHFVFLCVCVWGGCARVCVCVCLECVFGGGSTPNVCVCVVYTRHVCVCGGRGGVCVVR